MDEVNNDDFYGSESLDCLDSTNYYFYAFAATVIIGLPLFFIAMFKIYMDHQHHQDEQDVYREKKRMYRDATQGITANLLDEVNQTRVCYERGKIEREQNERQIHSDYRGKIRGLELQIHTQITEIEDLKAEHRETLEQEKKKAEEMLTSLHDDLRREKENFRVESERHEGEKEDLQTRIQNIEGEAERLRSELRSTIERLEALKAKRIPQKDDSSRSWLSFFRSSNKITTSVPEDDSKTPSVPEDDSTNS